MLGCAVVCLWVYSVWSHGTVPLEGCIHFWKWGMKEDICSVNIISFHCRAPNFRACVWCREAHYLHESSRCLAWRGLCVFFISCLESFCFLWKPLGRYCWDRGIVFSVIVKLAPMKWNTASSFIASFFKWTFNVHQMGKLKLHSFISSYPCFSWEILECMLFLLLALL